MCSVPLNGLHDKNINREQAKKPPKRLYQVVEFDEICSANTFY